MLLPTVEFCGLNPTRLLIGANPFGGYSHQNKDRNEAMRNYYTVDRIIETWQRAEEAGINTMVTNNETPHVLEAVKTYLSGGGKLQWIAQLNKRMKPNMNEAIYEAAEIGCCAAYFHGEQVENLFEQKDAKSLEHWCESGRRAGLIIGAAGHLPKAHMWVNTLDIVDFHAVCFFNCGSLHSGKGDKFRLEDVFHATECIRAIQKPCIGYKIMGAGRIDPQMAFEYAFENIKPTDIVNVGMHRGDNDNMVEENVAMVNGVLNRR